MEGKIPQALIKTNNLANKKVVWILVGLVIVLGLALTYVSYLLNNTRTIVIENTSESNVMTPEISESEGIKNDPMNTWKTYTNEEYGFSFKYPENLSDTCCGISGPGYGNPEVAIIIGDESTGIQGTDAPFDGLAVYVVPNKSNLSLDQYIEKEKLVLLNQFNVMAGDGAVHKGKVLSESILGQPAIILDHYSWDRVTRTYFKIGSSNAILEISKTEKSLGHFSLYDQILSTFKFVDTDSADESFNFIIKNPSLDFDINNLTPKRYTLRYPKGHVAKISLLYRNYSEDVSGVSLVLKNGVTLDVRVSFEGSSIPYYTERPKTVEILNPNFTEKITRVLIERDDWTGYTYVTGHGEGVIGCSQWDPLPLACHMSTAYFDNIGGYWIICDTDDLSKVGMCDDLVENLNIEVEKIQ